jgi:BolA protein
MSIDGPMANAIRQTLQDALSPGVLEIINDSARHAGHSGDNGTGESHFSLTVVASQFAGLSRPARHRMIYQLLDIYFKSGLHALSIKAFAPGEQN